ncbi:MAG: arabinogalactan endo-beta-1,4-galactanase [Fimbriimonas sp.]
MLLACLALASFAPLEFRGGDASFLPEMESLGAKYFDGTKREDPLRIMKKHGLNTARLRIWVEPSHGWCNLEKTLKMAKRAKVAGLKVLLDFHYADDWADPGKQPKPRNWAGLTGAALVQRVEDYSREVVLKLVHQGTPPEVVQVGNEVISGMIWPDGKLDYKNPKTWDAFCDLLKAGLRGVKRASPKSLTMIHIDRGANWESTRIFYDNLRDRHVEFDLIGQSFYPWWHGTMEQMEENLKNTSERYGKGIVIVETAYPFTLDKMSGKPHMVDHRYIDKLPFPQTIAGQRQFVEKLVQLVKQTPNGLGKGVVWWAPDWLEQPNKHSVWENLNWYDAHGRVLPAIDALAR